MNWIRLSIVNNKMNEEHIILLVGLLLSVCLPVTANDEDSTVMHYRVTGECDSDVSYVAFTSDFIDIDTVAVVDGRFEYDGQTAKYVNFIAGPDKSNLTFFVAEGDTLHFTCDSVVGQGWMHGNEENDEWSDMMHQLQPFVDQLKAVSSKHYTEKGEAKNDEVMHRRLQMHDINGQIRWLTGSYVQSHPDSPVSVAFLWKYHNVYNDSLLMYYDVLGEHAKQSPLYPQLSAMVETQAKTRRGTAVTTEITTDINGTQFGFNNLSGKYVLVDFWATWCAPCLLEAKWVNKAQILYADLPLQVVSVSKDFDEARWRKYVTEHDEMSHYINILDTSDIYSKAFGVSGIPALFLISPDGRIVGKGFEGPQITELLETLKNNRDD